MRGNSHVQFLGGRGGSNAPLLPDQALETKARFISQVMQGTNALRSAQDIGGQELSYAEVKAIASGNPAVLTLAEADAELQRLSVLKKSHADEQYLARRSLRELPQTIERLSQRLSGLTQDMATAEAHAGDPITIGSRKASREDALDWLAARLDALPKLVQQPQRFLLGAYKGLQFGVILDPYHGPAVYLQGIVTRQEALSRQHHGPRAVLNALDRLAESYGTQSASTRRELTIAEGQLRDYQARLGQPFAHDAYLSQLTALRDQLKAGLASPEPGTAPPPPVSELAESIKALRAAHTIEAPAERTAARCADAEEPVTARIRRRTEATPAAPEITHQERLTRPAPAEESHAYAR